MKLALRLTVALIIVPLLAIPLYLAGRSMDPSNRDGLGVVLGLGIPALLSIVLMRWGGATNWIVAILLGIASGGIALCVLFVGLLVGCSATDCGS